VFCSHVPGLAVRPEARCIRTRRRSGELQGRVRLPPAAVAAGQHRRGPGRSARAGKRRREHRHRPHHREAAGWSQPWTVVAAAAAVAGLLALIVLERRAADPVLPPEMFRARGLSAFVTVGTLLFFAYYGFVFALSLYLGAATNDTALQIGLTLLPAAIPIVAVPPLSTRLVSRLGPTRVVVFGSIIAASGFVAVTVIDVHDRVGLCLVLLVIGVGSGLAFLPQAGLVMSAAPASHVGLVSGLMNATRQCGSLVGVAVLGALVAGGSARLHNGSGLRVAAFVSAAVMLLAGALAIRPRSRPGD